MPHTRFSAAEQSEVWDRWGTGRGDERGRQAIGRYHREVHDLVEKAGGPTPRAPTAWWHWRLSLADGEEISRGLAAGRWFRTVADRLKRAPSTISRERDANGGRAR